MKHAGRRAGPPWRRVARATAAATALEFGLVSVPFLVLVLGSLEVAFDLYTKAVLDISLVQAARQIQVGNSKNASSGIDFVNRYFCTGMGALLDCKNVFVRVQLISPTGTQDFYDFTTGLPPVSGGVLNLAGYGSSNFCNGGPSQLLLISAVYVGPSILGRLLPGAFSVSYNGSLVHATFASVGAVTEDYSAAAAAAGAAPAC